MDPPDATNPKSCSESNALFAPSLGTNFDWIGPWSGCCEFPECYATSSTLALTDLTPSFPVLHGEDWSLPTWAHNENFHLPEIKSSVTNSDLETLTNPSATLHSRPWIDSTIPSCLEVAREWNQVDSSTSQIANTSVGLWGPFPKLSLTEKEILRARDSNCDWPQCSTKGPFNTTEEAKLHTKHHANNVRSSWKPSQKCAWHGCTSNARHKTAKLFEDHLNNIHINPLICTRDDCNYRKPFRGKADLQRHIATVHIGKKQIKCPYRTCVPENKTFSRKDKLICHLREFHGTTPCPYSHCPSRTERTPGLSESTAKHVGKTHGAFECAVRSCRGSESQFSEDGLAEHLQVSHNMNWEVALKTRDMVKSSSETIVREEHLLGMPDFSDCNLCVENVTLYDGSDRGECI